MALGFSQYARSEQYLYTKEELLDRMCAALGGRVAESLVFNRVTTGAQNDLEKVTKMAYSQIKYYGMNSTVGLVSFPEEDNKESRRPYSKQLAALIDAEARQLVANAYMRSEEILRENRSKLEKVRKKRLFEICPDKSSNGSSVTDFLELRQKPLSHEPQQLCYHTTMGKEVRNYASTCTSTLQSSSLRILRSTLR